MATLGLLRTENSGVIYADASGPDLTVRFKHSTTKKTLNGVVVDNHLLEIIVNDELQVQPVTGTYANDALSVRVRVSGSNIAASQTQLGVIIHALADQIQTWVGENVLIGFNPTTAPVIPAAA